MALGPKAMGAAIIANLKPKTGKDITQWCSELRGSGITDPTAARAHLATLGLGRFQAVAVVEYAFGLDSYSNDAQLIEMQFARFPEQRKLYDRAIAQLDASSYSPKPCRTYLPIYRNGRIALSFKATKNGLYAALNLTNPGHWPNRTAHKPSLGGSTRLGDGVYLTDATDVDRLLNELDPA
jgi:hypothetical protein